MLPYVEIPKNWVEKEKIVISFRLYYKTKKKEVAWITKPLV